MNFPPHTLKKIPEHQQKKILPAIQWYRQKFIFVFGRKLAEKAIENNNYQVPINIALSLHPADTADLLEALTALNRSILVKKISKQKKCAIAGSLMIREENKVYNRLIWISKNGEISTYDKRHLFSLIKEPL